MMKDLNLRAFGGLFFLLIVIGAALFITAGTLNYWQGWLFLAVFGVSVSAITVYLMKNDPKLLERRVKAGPTAEKEKTQIIIQIITTIEFIALLILPAVDHRLGWSVVPQAIVFGGDMLVALGLYMVFIVFKENTFTSATIEIHDKQKVISTGPYARVRHPMYTGSLVMLLGLPLALGSWWGLLAVIPMKLTIMWRLLEEENFLVKNLPGYKEYKQKVKYRLVPFIW
jgi:protein-S-isoprenylcysteine O-methyltransferase Ste14